MALQRTGSSHRPVRSRRRTVQIATEMSTTAMARRSVVFKDLTAQPPKTLIAAQCQAKEAAQPKGQSQGKDAGDDQPQTGYVQAQGVDMRLAKLYRAAAVFFKAFPWASCGLPAGRNKAPANEPPTKR